MADTRVQLEVEDWVRLHWMPAKFGQKFHHERVGLSAGGVFDFDAVSEDRNIVGTISTSGAKTASGKHAVGKLLKIRSDMLFLVMAKAQRRVVVLTERGTFDLCRKESEGGRGTAATASCPCGPAWACPIPSARRQTASSRVP